MTTPKTKLARIERAGRRLAAQLGGEFRILPINASDVLLRIALQTK